MKDNNFVGYEYQEVTTKRNMASMYVDGYENFGWQLEGTGSSDAHTNAVAMKFKRDRKLHNKAELTRLQRQFDNIANEIQSLEDSKSFKASIAAFTVGIIGCAFLAGSVFAVIADLIAACVVLAIPGFICWIIPYFLYRKMTAAKTAEVTPMIDGKYDEIYNICENASGLLTNELRLQ